MKKSYLIYLLAFTAVIGLIILAYMQNNKINIPSDGKIIYYYGDGCPHCANVDKFFTDNKITEKIQFEKKEVYNNTTNSEEMSAKAKICKISENKIGVPFLWTGSGCVIGDKPIIEFFKEQTGIK